MARLEGGETLKYRATGRIFEVKKITNQFVFYPQARILLAGATLELKDFTGLKRIASIAGKHFKMGILLHDGDATISFGNNIYAVPLAALWT